MDNIIERAMKLAASGDYPELRFIEAQLRKEGYDDVELHLRGALTRQQLRQLMRSSRITAS